MKKPIGLATILLVALGVTINAHALNERIPLISAEASINEHVISTAFVDDHAYILTDAHHLIQFDSSTQQQTIVGTLKEADVLIGGASLGYINNDSGAVTLLTDDAQATSACIDIAALHEAGVKITKASMLNDHLIFLYQSTDGFSQEQRIARLELSTGDLDIFDVDAVQDFAPYEGDKIVVITNRLLEDYGVATLSIIANGRIERTLPALSSIYAGAVAFDAANDRLYVSDSGRLLTLQGESWEVVNYFPSLYPLGAYAAGCIPSDTCTTYIAIGDNCVILRNTDPAAIQDLHPLVVKGMGLDRESITKFLIEYPEIPLIVYDDYIGNAAEFIIELESGGSVIDIYLLPDYTGTRRLIEKGYALGLSDYENIASAISQMHTTIQNAVTVNNVYYGLPIGCSLQPWTVREDLLAEAGYDLPATLHEYFSMPEEWLDTRGEDLGFLFHDDSYISAGLPKYACIKMLFEQYVAQYESAAEPLSFNTTEFKSILEILDRLPYEDENVDLAIANQSPLAWMEQRDSIFFWDSYNILQIGISTDVKENTRLMPIPTFSTDKEPRVLASLILAVINQHSKCRDNAAFFLDFIADNQTAESRVTLNDSANESILYAPMVQAIEAAQLERVQLNSRLAMADEAHQAEIQSALEQPDASIASMENNKYSVTSDTIQKYRSVEEYMYVPYDSLYFSLSMDMREPFYTILKRYASGSISSTQMISELDATMKLLYLEQ